jgi:hypothetical protein
MALTILSSLKRQCRKKVKKNHQLRKKQILTGLGEVIKQMKRVMVLMNLKKHLNKKNNNSNLDGLTLMPMIKIKRLKVMKNLKNYRRLMLNK